MGCETVLVVLAAPNRGRAHISGMAVHCPPDSLVSAELFDVRTEAVCTDMGVLKMIDECMTGHSCGFAIRRRLRSGSWCC